MRRTCIVLALILASSLVGCGEAAVVDEDAAASARDAAPDAAVGPSLDSAVSPDASAPEDVGSPIDAAAPADASEPDAAPADASAPDAAPADASEPDAAPVDARAPDAAPSPDASAPDASFSIPSSCAMTSDCGPFASCVASRCLCSAGTLPCGTTCCPFSYARAVELDTAGHAPEIAYDGAGNVYVMYQRGSTSVRLATLTTGSTVATTEAVAASSGLQDIADLAVSPAGAVMIAVHQPGSGRSGALNLFSRAPGIAAFTSMSLRPTPPPPFAFDAAVSLSLAPGGDVYAGVAARSGDGTQGLALTRYDALAATWASLPTIRTAGAYSHSELFARDDGFFVGLHDFTTSQDSYESYSSAAASLAFLAVAVSVRDRGQSAAAMSDAGVLTMFTGLSGNGTLAVTDGRPDESVVFDGNATGAHSDIDMAFDADGNPAIVVHSTTHDAVSLMVRMPHGGFTRYSWSDSRILPPGVRSTWMTLDAERLPNGNIAIVLGDSMDRGGLHYMEISR